MPAGKGPKERFRLVACIAALVAFAPFLAVFLGGRSFHFRDLSGQFFPARLFALDGLAHGELRYWNPFVHEGEPVALPPAGYLPDLLQLLIPTEFGISLFLALHIPFAAVSFTLLARELGLGPVGALAGAVIYALGGFSLSTINLYVYAQTIAWAPLFILAFRRALEGGGARALALAGMSLAMTISTTGLEIAIQACLLAVVLTPPKDGPRILRATACAALGLGLVAVVVMPLLAITADSERGSGFSTSVVLAYSIHPLTLFQVLIAGFYGDTSKLVGAWWGQRFFVQGFPYILSLYLGPTVLALAGAGLTLNRPLRRRLALLALGAVAVGLGRYAGWEHLLDLAPSLHFLRYPVKAFFTVQAAIALLASFTVDEIASGNGARDLMRVAGISIGLGGSLVGILFIPSLAPGATAWFLDGFLPPGTPPFQRAEFAGFMTGDAATAGLVAIVVGGLCVMAYRSYLVPSRVAAAIVALVAADLLRAGAGLNTNVTTDFYQLSPEMSHQVDLIRQSGGRVFSCYPERTKGYWDGRRARGSRHEAFTMATLQETMTPDFNVPFGVKSALSPDKTSLVVTNRVLPEELWGCAKIGQIVPSLRAAGVTRVLSLDPLDDPSLRLLDEVAPARIAPLHIRIYELAGSLPRFSQPVTLRRERPDYLDLDVVADQPTPLTVRDPFAKGWRATINGVERPILQTKDGHREIALPSGLSEVRMRYEPPGLKTGMIISLVAALLCAGGLLAGPRSAANPRGLVK
jgi:hypothetical protein